MDMEIHPIIDQLVSFGTTYGLQIIGAIIILVVGRIAAGICRTITTRLLEKAKADPAIVTFTGSLVFIVVITFAVLAALAKFGIQTASFIAIIGAAGFAVGFALQGSLSNFAAGILILGFRPFRVGDFIDAAGVMGTVKEIHLFTTNLATPDNVLIIVPNSKLHGDIIKNYSANPTRRVDLVIGIGYGSSIEEAQRVVREILSV